MRDAGGRAAVLGILFLAAAAGPALPAGAAADRPSPLVRFLPYPEVLEGWTVTDEPQSFEGDDLFAYIDGGAEIYHEYGFSRALVQDYRRGEDSISLEIFEMRSPAAAFGVFTFKRGPDGEAVDIGAGASLEGYYLNFWKGRFLVTLTGTKASEAMTAGLLAAARSVAARIDSAGERPSLAEALPGDDLVPSSVRYIKGPLGFMNVCPSFPGDIVPFREGIKGDYADGSLLIILAYGSPGEAWAALGRAETSFRMSPGHRKVARGGDRLRVAGAGGRPFGLAARGSALIIVIGAASPDAEAAIMDAAAAKMVPET